MRDTRDDVVGLCVQMRNDDRRLAKHPAILDSFAVAVRTTATTTSAPTARKPFVTLARLAILIAEHGPGWVKASWSMSTNAVVVPPAASAWKTCQPMVDLPTAVVPVSKSTLG